MLRPSSPLVTAYVRDLGPMKPPSWRNSDVHLVSLPIAASMNRCLPQPQDLPEAPDDAVVVGLKDAPSWVEARCTISDYAQRLNRNADEVREMLKDAVVSKRVTFHCLNDET